MEEGKPVGEFDGNEVGNSDEMFEGIVDSDSDGDNETITVGVSD
jgi:hypothetical protein